MFKLWCERGISLLKTDLVQPSVNPRNDNDNKNDNGNGNGNDNDNDNGNDNDNDSDSVNDNDTPYLVRVTQET